MNSYLPDIAATPRILWKNRFRIGDAVAAFTLFHLIQKRRRSLGYDPAIMHVRDHEYLTALSREIGMIDPIVFQPATVEAAPPNETTVADTDGALWHWNFLFLQHGIRLPVRQRDVTRQVLFAPLPETDYAMERSMSMRFIRDVITVLQASVHTDLRVVMPLRPPATTRKLLTEYCHAMGVEIVEEVRRDAIARIATSRLFIGGDTGLSHVAGLYDNVRQIALHDRANTARHNDPTFDAQRLARERVRGFARLLGIDAGRTEYMAFPNKQGVARLLFDRNGADGHTLDAFIIAIDRLNNG